MSGTSISPPYQPELSNDPASGFRGFRSLFLSRGPSVGGSVWWSITSHGPWSGLPSSAIVQRRAIRHMGSPPRYIISDKGREFWCDSFKYWCHRRALRPRFGAVGKQGSIATVERFIRSMKNEYTRRIRIPLQIEAMRREVSLYATWYNEHRPNQALGGRTPREVHSGIQPANTRPRFEPRGNWPTTSPCASPQTAIRGRRGPKLSLAVSYMEGRRHLPVVELCQAA